MTRLSFGGLRAVFDLCQQLRLDPNALVRDLLGIGLRFLTSGFNLLADQAGMGLALYGHLTEEQIPKLAFESWKKCWRA
jgi:hypothetical protein